MMKSIKTKRHQSSVSVIALSAIGLVTASMFKEAAHDSVLVFQSVMALAMLTGVIGILTD
jgi:hypothetical protein